MNPMMTLLSAILMADIGNSYLSTPIPMNEARTAGSSFGKGRSKTTKSKRKMVAKSRKRNRG